jgi:hypothetical protein
VLKRIYGADAFPQKYSTTLNSVVFVGTILGMLTFGTNEKHPNILYSDLRARMDIG